MLSIGCILPAVKSPPRKRLLGLPTRWIEPLESRLLLNAGELDVVFNSTGMAASGLGAGDDQVHAMVVQPDSKIVTVGQSGDGSSEFTVARYDKDGQLDTARGACAGLSNAARCGKRISAGRTGTPGSRTGTAAGRSGETEGA
jgi:Domain of unknown function (DUF5122) beta-propeller